MTRLYRELCLITLLLIGTTNCDDGGASKSTEMDIQLKDIIPTKTDIIDAGAPSTRGCLEALPEGIAQVRSPCEFEVQDATYLMGLESDLFIENSKNLELKA